MEGVAHWFGRSSSVWRTVEQFRQFRQAPSDRPFKPMSRPQRAARVAGEARRKNIDPNYASDDDGFEAYLDHQPTDRFPCRVSSMRDELGDGFYKCIFVDAKGVPDGDETTGVHFDPNYGPGHGIWPRIDQRIAPENNKVTLPSLDIEFTTLCRRQSRKSKGQRNRKRATSTH